MSAVFSTIGTELLHIMSAFAEASEQFNYALNPQMLPELAWNPVPPINCGNADDTPVDVAFAQLANPDGLALTWLPAPGTRVGPGRHKLKATASDPKYIGLSAETEIVVLPLASRLTWAPPLDVTWVPGGYVLGAQQSAGVANPRNIALVYAPDLGSPLPPGRHRLTVRPADTARYDGTPVGVDLNVDKAAARIDWNIAERVSWAPGGFVVPDDAAVSDPPGAKVELVPAAGTKLPVGKRQFTARIADSEPYVGSDTFEITVEPVDAQLAWHLPEHLQADGASVALAEGALKGWVANPLKVALVFVPDIGTELAPGSHELTVRPADAGYVATPVKATLVVKGRPKLEWKQRPPVVFQPGGFDLSAEALALVVDNPADLKLEFDPPVGTRLPVGKHKLKMRAADQKLWSAAWVPGDFEVVEAKVRVVWNPPKEVEWNKAGVEVTEAMFGITEIIPPWAKLAYDPEIGDLLMADGNTQLSLRVIEKGCEDQTFTKKINVKMTPEQRRLSKLSMDEPPEKPVRKIDPEVLEQRQRAYELLRDSPIPNATLNAEYPFGAANKTPHIHKYGGDFHLKTEHGSRINLVQGGIRYEGGISEALTYTQDYDARKARGTDPTRLTQILEALLK